ncbi:hypothetical protein HID58_005911 [Brassica napus]|uniref:ERAD-associated E3 ubiquitin-protein ligase component HRD3A n=1 Tax=Brassica napus TaxID=3708 RepID=A0ABQ8E9W8_BRANA|nr:hypothetical protein HID58_005911 [Brassica napus]
MEQKEPKPDQELDPGSWRPVLELNDSVVDPALTLYYSALKKMVSAASKGNVSLMEEAVTEVNASASAGDPPGQSVMGFVYGMGMTREANGTKSFQQHQLAAEGGNMQSKMALAFRYIQLDMHDKAAQLYAEVAEAALSNFLISKDFSTVAPLRIHRGAVEDEYVPRRFCGEDAQIGMPSAMYKVGLFYYFSLRGLRHDHAKAVYWFSKAAEKGELRSMKILGEIYAQGTGVERNYTKAFECLTLAAEGGLDSAFTGLGYLYLKGYGVDKNYTKARECFEKVSDSEDPSGMYYLGMLYLKGIGVKRDVKKATKYFLVASNAGLPKAMYQIAKMLHAGAELRKNRNMLKLVTNFLTMNAKFLLDVTLYFTGSFALDAAIVVGGLPRPNWREQALSRADTSIRSGALEYKMGDAHMIIQAGTCLELQSMCVNLRTGVEILQMRRVRGTLQVMGQRKLSAQDAAAFYKSVAERGPWNSLSRWALEAYMKGDVGKAFILYSRMSELGYEVAQSNAAWILDKYGERSMCMGVSEFCTVKERKERAHALWWRASKQGNDYAALLVGDAYYYGRGKERDFVRAAEAYMQNLN